MAATDLAVPAVLPTVAGRNSRLTRERTPLSSSNQRRRRPTAVITPAGGSRRPSYYPYD